MTALVSRIIVPSVYRNDQRVPTANNFMIALRLLGTQTQIVDLSKSNWAPEELTYTIYILGYLVREVSTPLLTYICLYVNMSYIDL